MNTIAKRTYFALSLACILLLGMAVFIVRYFVDADQWVGFSGSPHLYDDQGNLDVNIKITDRDGTTLYTSEAGKTYADSESVRRAVLHLTGDRAGNIPSILLDEYCGDLVGYSKLNGTYGAIADSGTEVLTVNADVEATALQALGSYKGTVGVYNYKTGEILCAVSTPTFDPNNAPSAETVESSTEYDGVYVNRFINATYTPGSVFKLVTTAAAIENLKDYDTRTWECTGSYDIGKDTVVCNGTHGTVTLEQALAESCNSTFAQISMELGAGTLEKYADQVGITSSISFDGYTTRKGNFDLSGAAKFVVAWAGIGQGSGENNDLINPCQYMTYMGAIANGGQAASPYLVSEVRNGDRAVYTAKTKLLDRALDRDTADVLKKLMRNNVQTMYGAITIDKYVCAKSGTAEVGDKNNTATFAGFIADDDYPLAFIVVVEEGGSGSQTAAPIANTVLWKCIEVMNAG